MKPRVNNEASKKIDIDVIEKWSANLSNKEIYLSNNDREILQKMISKVQCYVKNIVEYTEDEQEEIYNISIYLQDLCNWDVSKKIWQLRERISFLEGKCYNSIKFSPSKFQ